MTSSEQVKMLREMANGQDKLAKHYARVPNLSAVFTGKSDALNAGAEALEAMSAKQVSATAPTAQKAEILSSLADTADALARLDCGLTDRAGMAQRAALFRECAAMMREGEGVLDGGWRYTTHAFMNRGNASCVANSDGSWSASINRRGGLYTTVTQSAGTASTLSAAQAAAIAWVDGQEGK